MGKKHNLSHHIIATSISGESQKWNLYHWETEKKHIAWHNLFKNFPPSVCIKIIEGWCNENRNGRLNPKMMGKINIKAWPVVFNGKSDKTPRAAIKFIKKEFLPAEEIFLKIQTP